MTQGQLGTGDWTAHTDHPPRWQKQQLFLGSYQPTWSWFGQLQKCAGGKPERARWQETYLFTASFYSYSASFCLCFKTPFPVSIPMKPAFISELPHSFFKGVSLTGKGEAETFPIQEKRAIWMCFRTFLHLLYPNKAFSTEGSLPIALSGGAAPPHSHLTHQWKCGAE